MRPNNLVTVSLVIVATILLFFTDRAATLRPLHPYAAQDFSSQELTGERIRLSDLRGKVVVLNFWATWCSGCKREIPWLNQLQSEYGPQGLQILGVSMDDGGRKAVEPFARTLAIHYPLLIGDEAVSSAYGGIDVLPTTFYISREGNVLAITKGVMDKTEIEQNIRHALGLR